MKCANKLCEVEIPDGKQVAVWYNTKKGLGAYFVCEKCCELLEKEGAVEEIDMNTVVIPR